MIPNKPRFVDLRDEVGELLLESERRSDNVKVLKYSQVDILLRCLRCLFLENALEKAEPVMHKRLVTFPFVVKPTTLSGKQASMASIEVLAMLAAMVMQSVPFGHMRLCRRPSSV